MRPIALLLAAVAVLALALSTWRSLGSDAAAPAGLPPAEATEALDAELRAPGAEREDVAPAAEREEVQSPAGLEVTFSPPSEAETAPPESATRVFGFVRDADGRAVPGVAVIAASTDESHEQVSTRSDASGVYELALESGPWRLTAVTHGFARTAAELDVAANVAEADGPTLVLVPGATIRGRVIDDRGRRVSGIPVACSDEENGAVQFFAGGEPVEYGFHHVNTDAEGRFEFVGLEDATHRLTLRLHLRPDLVAESEHVTGVPAGADDVVLRVRTVARFAGRVVNAATGEPVLAFRFNGEAVETTDGTFERSLGVDSVMRVHAPGYLVWSNGLIALELPPGEQLVALEPDPHAARMDLRIVDAAGNELPNASVLGWTGTGQMVVASGEGPFALEGLTAATYKLKVAALGFLTRVVEVELTAGADEQMTVVLEPGYPVRVRAYDSLDRVEENARIRVELPDGTGVACKWTYDHAPRGATFWISELPLPTEPDSWAELRHEIDGRLEGLPVGTYTLVLETAEGVTRATSFAVSPESETELNVNP